MSIEHGIDDDYIYRGQAKRFVGTFSTPTNITGWTIEQRFRAVRNGVPLVTLTPTVTDATNGIMTSQLTAAQTRLMTSPTIFCEYWRTDTSEETPIGYAELTVKETIKNSLGL